MVVATREAVVTVERFAFSTDQFERMIDVGILTDRDRVELIEGAIVEMAAIGFRHVYCVVDAADTVRRGLPPELRMLTQSPFRLSDDSRPEPDVLVYRREVGRSRLPESADVFLLIEVSDSSLAYDRRVKLPLYGAAGIPEAWIFDVTTDTVERHSDPFDGGYRAVAVAVRGETIASLAVPTVTFDVDAVFGRPEETDEQG